ncbi:hypothetical protein ScPMuIL_010742 [Solemya velum]
MGNSRVEHPQSRDELIRNALATRYIPTAHDGRPAIKHGTTGTPGDSLIPNVLKMKYCQVNNNFDDVWYDHGLNPCFIDTVTSSILLFFISLCGCIQCSAYRRYATPISKKYHVGRFGYTIQVCTTILMMVAAVLLVILQDVSIGDQRVAGYQLLNALVAMVIWPLSLRLMCLERNNALPSIPTRGHGLVLLIFWTLAFVRENVAFVSWWNQSWWWYLESDGDRIEFSLWLIRYLCTFLLFVLGFRAPGLPRSINHLLLDEEEQHRAQTEPKSTWSNIWKKVKLMLPFIWPKGSPKLQITVFFCVILLVAGRGINVLVPIYNKNIGKINDMTLKI